MAFPKQSDVEVPLLAALADLGGSAKPSDLYAKVAASFPALTADEQELRLESTPSVRKWWNLVQWVRQASSSQVRSTVPPTVFGSSRTPDAPVSASPKRSREDLV